MLDVMSYSEFIAQVVEERMQKDIESILVAVGTMFHLTELHVTCGSIGQAKSSNFIIACCYAASYDIPTYYVGTTLWFVQVKTTLRHFTHRCVVLHVV